MMPYSMEKESKPAFFQGSPLQMGGELSTACDSHDFVMVSKLEFGSTRRNLFAPEVSNGVRNFEFDSSPIKLMGPFFPENVRNVEPFEDSSMHGSDDEEINDNSILNGHLDEYARSDHSGINEAIQSVRIAHTEFDRFIPQRNNAMANAYDTKDVLFAAQQFKSTNCANEVVDYRRSRHAQECGLNQPEQILAMENNQKLYQTLLASQLMRAENAHNLKQGALNEHYDEDQGGILQADRLARKFNALDFKQPAEQLCFD